jgi:hypothetical protein
LCKFCFCDSVKQLRNTGKGEQVKWKGLGEYKLVLISQLLSHSYPSVVNEYPNLNVLAQRDLGNLSCQERGQGFFLFLND